MCSFRAPRAGRGTLTANTVPVATGSATSMVPDLPSAKLPNDPNLTVRASGASSRSFRPDRALVSILRHSSIGTTTAVSTPRLVTI